MPSKKRVETKDLNDEVINALTELARNQGKSRSELLAELIENSPATKKALKEIEKANKRQEKENAKARRVIMPNKFPNTPGDPFKNATTVTHTNTFDPNKETVLINAVVDMSGSMAGLSDATVTGFNSYLDEQENQPGKTLVSLTLFDTVFENRYVGVPVETAGRLFNYKTTHPKAKERYGPRGCTALYDAVGRSIKAVEAELTHRPVDRVLFIIITDGEENSSVEWNRYTVSELVKGKQALGNWHFVFQGANKDKYLAQAAEIGISPDFAINYNATPDGVAKNFVSTVSRTATYRATPVAAVMNFNETP